MLIKWLALGFKVYFTNAWCWLDFVIVMVSPSRWPCTNAFDSLSLFLSYLTNHEPNPNHNLSKVTKKIKINYTITRIRYKKNEQKKINTCTISIYIDLYTLTDIWTLY